MSNLNMDGSLAHENSHLTFSNVNSAVTKSRITLSGRPSRKSFEAIFPVFVDFSRKFPINKHIVFVIFIIQLIQCFISAYQPFSFFWSKNNYFYFILEYSSYIIDFGSRSNSDHYIFIQIVTLSIIPILSTVLLLYIILYYRFYNGYNNLLLYMYRILSSYISHIIFIPVCCTSGYCFYSWKNDDSIYMVIGFFTLLFGIILCFFTIFVDLVIRFTTLYPENTILIQWFDYTYIYYITVTALFPFFCRFFSFSPRWIYYTCVFFYCMILSILCYYFTLLPFMKVKTNSLLLSLTLTQIVSSLVVLIPNLYTFIKIVIPISVFMIVNSLSNVVFENLVNSDKVKNNFSTVNASLRALRSILYSDPERFLSFKDIKTVFELYSSPELILRLARLVCFFPTEYRRVLSYISLIPNLNELSLINRFLYYQVQYIHIQRQSHSTNLTKSELRQVEKDTQLSTMILSIYMQRFMDNRNYFTIDIFFSIGYMKRKIDICFIDLLNKYPYNAIIIKKYGKFLLEHADYSQGLMYLSNAKKLKNGTKIQADIIHQYLTRIYPRYLEYSLKSESRQNMTSTRRYAGSNNGGIDIFFTTLTETGPDINSDVLNNARFYLAIQNYFSGAKPPWLNVFSYTICILSFLILLVFTLVFTGRILILKGIATDNLMLNSVSEVINDIEKSYYLTLDRFNIIKDTESSLVSTFEEIVDYSYSSVIKYLEMLYYFSALDINESEIINLPLYLYAFNSLSSIETSFDHIITSSACTLFYAQSTLNSKSDELAFALLNYPSIIHHFYNTTNNIFHYLRYNRNKTEFVNENVMYFAPVFMYIFVIIPLIIVCILMLRKFQHQIKLFGLIPNHILNETSRVLNYREKDLNKAEFNNNISYHHKYVFIAIPLIIFLIESSLLFCMFCVIIYKQHSLHSLNYLLLLANVKKSYVLRSINIVYIQILMIANKSLNYVNYIDFYDKELLYVKDTIIKMQNEMMYFLLYDSTNHISSNVVKKMSNIIDETCTDVIDYSRFECMSLDQLFNLYSSLVNDAYFALLQKNNTDEYSLQHLFNVSLKYIIPKSEQLSQFIHNMYDSTYSVFAILISIIYIGSIIGIVILISYLPYIKSICTLAYKSFLMYIQKLPQSYIIENINFINTIINRYNEKIISDSLGFAIIDSCKDPVVILNNQEIIQYMNKSACNSFGYTKEQMIGNSIITLGNDIFRTESNYFGHVITESGVHLPYNITKFVIDKFTLLYMKSMTEINKCIEGRKQAEKTLESLFKMIKPINLPDNIPGFRSDFACVVVIDLVKLTDYVTVLSPQSFIKNLESLFSVIYSKIRQYNLEQIRIYNNTFICSAGFMEKDPNKNKILEDVLGFCISCFHGLEEINNFSETNFEVKITIATGGPVYCGYISNNIPRFSLFGDIVLRAIGYQKYCKGNLILMDSTSISFLKEVAKYKVMELKTEEYDELYIMDVLYDKNEHNI